MVEHPCLSVTWWFNPTEWLWLNTPALVSHGHPIPHNDYGWTLLFLCHMVIQYYRMNMVEHPCLRVTWWSNPTEWLWLNTPALMSHGDRIIQNGYGWTPLPLCHYMVIQSYNMAMVEHPCCSVTWWTNPTEWIWLNTSACVSLHGDPILQNGYGWTPLPLCHYMVNQSYRMDMVEHPCLRVITWWPNPTEWLWLNTSASISIHVVTTTSSRKSMIQCHPAGLWRHLDKTPHPPKRQRLGSEWGYQSNTG